MKIADLTLIAWMAFVVSMPVRAQGGCVSQPLDKSPGAGFQPGTEYVAIAHELSPESRPWFGLPWTGERALGVNGWGSCSVMPADEPAVLRLIGAAPGYPPKP